MTTSAYIIAWLIYLLAGTGFNIIFWNLSQHWRKDLKDVSRVALLIMLFTPYFSDPTQYKLAPALLIGFFELVFGDKNIALHATTPLLVLLLLATGVLLAIHTIRNRLSRNK